MDLAWFGFSVRNFKHFSFAIQSCRLIQIKSLLKSILYTMYNFLLLWFSNLYIHQRVYFLKMCLDFGSNQIQLKSYQENRVTAWVKIYTLSTQLLQIQKLRPLYFRWWYWPWSFEEITQIRNSWSWRIPRGLVWFYSLNFRLQLLKKKKFKKIAWIQSHHLQRLWKLKLLMEKFTLGVKAIHCWVLSPNFWKQKVCWHHPAMFCFSISSKLFHQ